jgi:CelD/BcsL family acetyltransferase involved in cellulose biosynthesis
MNIYPIEQNEFDSIGEEWNRLLSRSISDNVFLRWEWIHTWWKIFRRPNRRLFILVARSDSRLVCVAPFYIERRSPWGTKILKFCGDELSPEYLDIIAEKGCEAEAVQAVSAFLKQSRCGWDLISSEVVKTNSLLLANSPLSMDYHGISQPSFSCPYTKFDGKYERTHNRKRKLLLNRMKVTHRVIKDAGQLPECMDHLFYLHQQRSGLKKQVSEFLRPDAQRFHRELAKLFLEAGILNLHFFYDGETPVSVVYAFDYDKKTYCFQCGHDPRWSKWSVGTVLFDMTVQNAFARGMNEFDFLKGDESYKKFFCNASREEVHVSLYNNNLRGLALYVLARAKSFVRKLLKQPAKDKVPGLNPAADPT